MGDESVAYVLGRRVYAFSALTNRWDVLELELAEGQILSLGLSADKTTLTVRHGSHIYTFRPLEGIWKDFDLNAILDGGQPVK